jgi:hypothetical protein
MDLLAISINKRRTHLSINQSADIDHICNRGIHIVLDREPRVSRTGKSKVRSEQRDATAGIVEMSCESSCPETEA